MLIGAGNPDVVSFNDVGTPDSRLTSRLKVHINAQVVRIEDLNWYFRLLQLCPDIPGELKSAVVSQKFNDLPFMNRTEIWTTLAKVQIHIVDPRPYKARQNAILRSVFKRPDAPDFVRTSASEGLAWANRIQSMTQRFAAESILRDSMASRAHRIAHAFAENQYLMMEFEPIDPPDLVTVDDFKCDSKAVVKKVTEWSAKASAAFHAAMDALETFSGDETRYRFSVSNSVRRKMLRPLMDVHAFDKGDSQQMRVLEEARNKLIDSMTDPHDPFSNMIQVIKVPKYCEFDSKDTFFGQAADIAAGIASTLFEHEGLASVVSLFEHVTYNGKRRGLSDVAEILHTLDVG